MTADIVLDVSVHISLAHCFSPIYLMGVESLVQYGQIFHNGICSNKNYSRISMAQIFGTIEICSKYG